MSQTGTAISAGARFELGEVYLTPGARDALAESAEGAQHFLDRHAAGDWGDLSDGDQQENELSVEKGFRIWSAYHTSGGTKLWVITEADRSTTTILLPDEY